MKILKMTASFGQLEKRELVLQDGLNVLTAPNESGKSTWSAFLLAMLYGIDSSERTSRTNLPAKTRYKPWSGAPMEGRVELEWNGRQITLERSTHGRVPMGEFRAYETDTGRPIPEMTGENCGELLLGVERSVFERSAFLGQNAISVSSDAALERRLTSLVTTGEEDISYSETAKRLKDWKNRYQHNRTGLLPQTRAELEQVEYRLSQIHELHRGDLDAQARLDQLTGQQKQLQDVIAALKIQEGNRRLEQKEQAAAELAQKKEKCAALSEQLAGYPSPQALHDLDEQLALLQSRAQEEQSQEYPMPEPPVCPSVFAGLREDQLLPKARHDAGEFDRLTAGKYAPAGLYIALLAAALAIAVAAFLLQKPLFAGIALLAAVICGGGFFLARKHNQQRGRRLDDAQAILKQYDNRSRDELVPFAAEYHEKLLMYQQKLEQCQAQRNAQETRVQALREQRARLLGQVSMFAPGVEGTHQARSAIAQIQTLYENRLALQNELHGAQVRYDAICTALGDLQRAAEPKIDLTGRDLRQSAAQLLQLNSDISRLRSQLDQSRGRVEALGDPAALEAEREQLRGRVSQQQNAYAALELAQQTLEKANGELQSRFSPQISALAGELMRELTADRYDTVLLDSDLQAEARQTGDVSLRQLLSLSSGTADQIYLAVRLAICRLVLGPGVPLVLDDALVRFDDERMKAALRLLQKESAQRQILLFTCQNREQQALEVL